MQKINPVGFWEGSGLPALPLGAQSRGTPVPWAGGAGSGFPKRKTPGTGVFGGTPPVSVTMQSPGSVPGAAGPGGLLGGGRKDLLQHGITEAGASPGPGGRGGASKCPRGPQQPPPLLPYHLPSGGKGGCGGKAIHAGRGGPPWGGMRQEQRVPGKDAEGEDSPGEWGKAGIISGQ